MTTDGGRRTHVYSVHNETQYRHPSLVVTSDGEGLTIAAFFSVHVAPKAATHSFFNGGRRVSVPNFANDSNFSNKILNTSST